MWEYKIIQREAGDHMSGSQMTLLGQKGWELVQVLYPVYLTFVHGNPVYQYIFKKGANTH